MFGLRDVAVCWTSEPQAVFAHNWPTFQVWRDTWRQWRWIGGGLGAPMRTGLDWTQVEAVMRMRRIAPRVRASMLDGLRAMEEAALEVIFEVTTKQGA